MYDIDEITFLNGGLSLYSGITGGKRLLEWIDNDKYGIEHTGMVGDIALGSFYSHIDDAKVLKPTGMYSERLKEKLPAKVIEFRNRFDTYEIFLMYARGFHGAVNTHMIRKNFTEVGSPFLDVDFLQMCYEIPVEHRIGHNIYIKWIKSKYPEAAKFVWEKTGGTILESKYKTFFRKIIKKGPKKVMRLLGMSNRIDDGMNPIDYWIKHNSRLESYLDDYEEKYLNKFKSIISQELSSDMDHLYKTGNASEKAMVLTVLASIKLYFGDSVSVRRN